MIESEQKYNLPKLIIFDSRRFLKDPTQANEEDLKTGECCSIFEEARLRLEALENDRLQFAP
jgi:hypothetical protein